jgi:hydroxyacylglutathione hydrolase
VTAPRIETIAVGPLACNCSIVVDPESGEAAAIDPGDEADRILDTAGRLGARLVRLLHTHAHFDHIGATRRVAEATGAPICLHPEDSFLYERLPEQARLFGISCAAPRPVDHAIRDGERLRAGGLTFLAIHTPGHSPGSCCFLLEGMRPVLFAGDTLFRDSIGRTDLWGGSFDEIAGSIRERLYTLPEDLRVVPGHGDETTIGRERMTNPFVRGT